jgi:phosphoenolpyruvate-protein phosphotransferase (PTS system enzyme I)
MRPAAEFKGRPASEGIFAGPVAGLGGAGARRRLSGNPARECADLEAAIAAARAAIAGLMERTKGEAAEMLGFQLAMLEDATLTAPALAEIERGVAADAAWQAALAHEIAGYEMSEDEYFRARAADLKDIRDRVLRTLAGETAAPARSGAILVGEDLAPSLFLETDWTQGGAIALAAGSASSHVAMLARSRGIPMVVGLGTSWPGGHGRAIVDGGAGLVVADPPAETVATYARRAAALAVRKDAERQYLLRPARRKDGTKIEVLVNIASVEELKSIDAESCDGIGLMRSEFLFRDGAELPDEERQYRAYRALLEWAKDRPVTIRTLDIGGDKPISGLTLAGEKNPFLGLRGVRLTLARPEVFRVQLRALARAALHGNLKIMLPMVTVPEEIRDTAALLTRCVEELKSEGVACALPPVGIMVEVPAAAVAPELFTAAAFFSIGSNDLTQYVTAASRDEPSVASLNDPAHPAVARLIAAVAAFGRERGIAVSLCGDMASEPKHLPLLIAAGITSLSVAPAALARVKAAIAEL